jgi:hypothetical protein
MKRLFILLLAIAAYSATSNAQFTKLGGGLNYTTGFYYNNESSGFLADLHKSPNFGIFTKGIYEFNLPLHASPSFTFYFPRKNDGEFEDARVSAMCFDLNAHYVFNSLDRFEFFGLAGLDILLARIKWIGTTSSDNDTALGLNIGAGSYMKMTEQIDLFLEAKYIVSRYDQFVINAGVLLNLQWLAKNEKPGI